MPSRNAFEKKALVIAIAISFGGTSIAARADTLEDLRGQIETLKKKMLELEQKQQTTEQKQADAAENVVTAGATKGSFKLPGSNTSVTLGGYVKLDAVYSNPSAGAGTTADLFLQPNAIAVGPGAATTSATSSSSALASRECSRRRARRPHGAILSLTSKGISTAPMATKA